MAVPTNSNSSTSSTNDNCNNGDDPINPHPQANNIQTIHSQQQQQQQSSSILSSSSSVTSSWKLYDFVDCLDTVKKWCEGRIVQIDPVKGVFINYTGWR